MCLPVCLAWLPSLSDARYACGSCVAQDGQGSIDGDEVDAHDAHNAHTALDARRARRTTNRSIVAWERHGAVAGEWTNQGDGGRCCATLQAGEIESGLEDSAIRVCQVLSDVLHADTRHSDAPLRVRVATRVTPTHDSVWELPHASLRRTVRPAEKG